MRGDEHIGEREQPGEHIAGDDLAIPDGYRFVFYTATTALIVGAGWMLSLRVRNWERGTPDRRPTTARNVHRRLCDLRAGLFMRTLRRDPAAGAMHSAQRRYAGHAA